MEHSPIETEEEYEAALKEIAPMFELDDNSIDAEQMETLFNLIEAYEEKHYPIPKPNLINRILYYLESRGILRP